jgi:hypothetical protein
MGLISHSHLVHRLKMCIAVFISINSVSHGLLWGDMYIVMVWHVYCYGVTCILLWCDMYIVMG